MLPSGEWLRLYWPDFPTSLPTPLPFDALNEGDPFEPGWFIFSTGKLEWVGYNLVKVTRWLTQVVWAQYINVTDAQHINVTDTQPRHHSKRHSNTLCQAATNGTYKSWHVTSETISLYSLIHLALDRAPQILQTRESTARHQRPKKNNLVSEGRTNHST